MQMYSPHFSSKCALRLLGATHFNSGWLRLKWQTDEKKKKPDFWFASRLQRAELHSCLFTCSSKVKSLLKITPRLLLTDFALECTLFAGMVWNTKICHDGVISPLYPLSLLTSRQRCNRQKLHVSSAFLCKVSHGVVVFVLIYFVFFHFCICRLMAVCKH